MAFGPSRSSNGPAFSEPTNGASLLAKPFHASEPAEGSKPSPDANFDEAKHTDETTSAQQDPDTANVVPEQSTTKPSLGNKRTYDSTTSPVDTDKAGAQNATEAAPKKQRTDSGDAGAQHGPSAPTPAKNTKRGQATNGDKKKGERPKKAKATIRRDLLMDGIGSRTRSRTKVAS
ncbi:hypothetical protein BO94DRAFT_101126 [Aspergillus sclerotioniger CBS 115572]|uniref:Uncharacterized protein n=1 Tax=Aspergillus sclerotioniger CBS 115572 TaxID=1450535 RepID=A0A317WDL9_9EURO|nr:hypothetical protein BO94DRAFT_101126 [Aspergillus sclerotioniger CBS 115572]PWY84504.1 hypothetical protein BO94DRAFT_101126 [Aspergillus sclerotioniger CBS 115572]